MLELEFPSLWTITDAAVDAWSRFGTITGVVQVAMVAGLVLLGIYMTVRFVNKLSNDETSNAKK